MNKVILIGRWVRENELRYMLTGTAVTKNTIAVDRRKNGTDFIPVTCFGKTAENTAQYTGKGSLVAVSGSIQVDKYEKDGQKRTFVSVVASEVKFLDRKNKDEFDDIGTEVEMSQDELPF